MKTVEIYDSEGNLRAKLTDISWPKEGYLKFDDKTIEIKHYNLIAQREHVPVEQYKPDKN